MTYMLRRNKVPTLHNGKAAGFPQEDNIAILKFSLPFLKTWPTIP